MGKPLSVELMTMAINEFAQRLQAEQLQVEMYLFGGANMIFSYGARTQTDEIDSAFRPSLPKVYDILREVGKKYDLPNNWIDMQSPKFLPPTIDRQEQVLYDHPSLRVLGASPEHMLAMKLMAARTKDTQDVKLLLQLLGTPTRQQVEGLFANVWETEPLPAAGTKLLNALFEEDPPVFIAQRIHSMPKCAAKTATGGPCPWRAIPGNKYCGVHRKSS